MTDNQAPVVEKTEEKAEKSSSYTMAVLNFARAQFFAAFEPVPTIYKTIYPAQKKEDFEIAAEEIARLEKAATDARAYATRLEEELNTFMQKVSKLVLSNEEGENLEEIQNQAQKSRELFEAADKKAKEAEAQVSSSLMKRAKAFGHVMSRFLVGAISAPFWIVGQALNFAARMVVALASFLAAVPTAGVESLAYGVNYAVTSLIKTGKYSYSKIFAETEKGHKLQQPSGAYERQNAQKDNLGSKASEKVQYTLNMLAQEAIAVEKSLCQIAFNVLKEKPETNILNRQTIVDECQQILARVDLEKFTLDEDLQQSLEFESLINTIKMLASRAAQKPSQKN